MIGNVLDMLFVCAHKNYSFPITAKKGSTPHCEAEQVTGTYVVCLDCGKEFPYDWGRMKVVSVRSANAANQRLASRSDPDFVKVA
jgi:hypothetical protein